MNEVRLDLVEMTFDEYTGMSDFTQTEPTDDMLLQWLDEYDVTSITKNCFESCSENDEEDEDYYYDIDERLETVTKSDEYSEGSEKYTVENAAKKLKRIFKDKVFKYEDRLFIIEDDESIYMLWYGRDIVQHDYFIILTKKEDA